MKLGSGRTPVEVFGDTAAGETAVPRAFGVLSGLHARDSHQPCAATRVGKTSGPGPFRAIWSGCGTKEQIRCHPNNGAPGPRAGNPDAAQGTIHKDSLRCPPSVRRRQDGAEFQL